MAQSCHVVFNFSQEYPNETKKWMIESNYIAILNCNNEFDLNKLIEKCILNNIKFSVFKESDYDNTVTAVALEPGVKSKKITSSFPLALKGL